MNIRKVKLIGYPDFFKTYKDNDFHNFNEEFWDYIFEPSRSGKNINHGNLSVNELNDLKYIYSNLKLVYKYFKIMKHNDIGIDVLVFCFNIIDNYLKILNRFIKGVEIQFFNYLLVKEDVYKNLEENIFYDFFLDIINNENILDGNDYTISVKLYFSDQLIQLHVLNHILNNNLKKNVIFRIDIDNLSWFENKKVFKLRILKDFKNVILDESLEEGKVDYIEYNGNKYYSRILFDSSCEWNKCSFCNIGKNNKLKLDKEKCIYNFIHNIIRDGIKHVQILDPSLTIPDLVVLSKEIIRYNIKVKIKVFARFSNNYTDEVLELLGKAGFKAIGIGLESTSTRLNNLMRKYDKDYTEEDFSNLVKRSSNYGIELHYYTIFGFPTETKEEIINTKKFLLNELTKDGFFSYTAGFFGLNKGTDIYINNEKYGVKYEENKKGSEMFIKGYYEKNLDENYGLLKETRNELITKLFFGNNKTKLDTTNFWFLIEHSNIFHIQKLYCNTNPYLTYFSKNDLINLDNLYSNKFEVNKYLQFIHGNKGWHIKNWLFNTHININDDIYDLLQRIDKTVSLNKNTNLLLFSRNDSNDKKILELVKGYFLIII